MRVIRAFVWARSVWIAAWDPVNERALRPRACSAIDRSAIVTCSPVASSMSISRGSGAGETWWARARRLSVVLPIAETMTTSWAPDALAATRRATLLIFASSATDEPPYFWTINAIELVRLQRSEEHTSELQSPCNLVCRLLLEKKKRTTTQMCNNRLLHD